MWKTLKILGFLLRFTLWCCLIVALLAVTALFVLERSVPQPLIDKLTAKISNQQVVCRIGRASFSLRSGLRLQRITLAPVGSTALSLITIDAVEVDLNLHPFTPHNERINSVAIHKLDFPSLPPDSKQDDSSKPLHLIQIPEISTFNLTLTDAHILGLRMALLEGKATSATNQISLSQVHVKWPNPDPPISLDGHLIVDLQRMCVEGGAKGQARPENIQPMLVALNNTSGVKYMSYFTNVKAPVDAEVDFGASLTNSDFFVFLKLDVGELHYQGVPFKSARGSLEFIETNHIATARVSPLVAESYTGPLHGDLFYHDRDESMEIKAKATMNLEDLANVIDILNTGELDSIRCATPITVDAYGIVATDEHKSAVTNALTGTISFAKGSILDLHVTNLTADYSVGGHRAYIRNIATTPLSGGSINGEASFHFPEFNPTNTTFTISTHFKGLTLNDLAQAVAATNTYKGSVSGNIDLAGNAVYNTTPSMHGTGKVEINDAVINRMPLFAGFTDYLANNVPGVGSIVDQSSGSFSFKMTNGVARSEDLLVEGDLFSLQGKGSYDLNTEQINFIVRANILRQRSIAGRIVRLVTLPVSHLLLEFRVYGTPEKQEWSYINLVEKIVTGISDLKPGATPKETPPKTTD